MKSVDQVRKMLDEIEEEWRAEVDGDQDEIKRLGKKLEEAEARAAALDDIAQLLYEAICEGRRQDAIDILNEATGENFRSVAEQRNLFPDRIPA